MKKIAIITLCGNMNYGNKLQNLALQEALKKRRFVVETIWNADSNHKTFKESVLLNFIKIKKIFKFKKNIYKLEKERKKKFINFNNKYLNYSTFEISKNKENYEIAKSYDYFFVGSDQVWNYNDPTFSDIYFLGFSPEKNKNYSYAASFGIDEIPSEYENLYKDKIKNFKKISVREKNGKNFLKKIGYKAEYVLDPTMLFNANDWNRILKIEEKRIIEEKYVLVYFLSEDESFYKKISDYCNEKKFRIINIFDYNDEYYVTDPVDFVNLVKNAEFIFTDSFHSTVFSIIYHKNFIVFNRKSSNKNITNSRMDNLLDALGLNDRKFKNEKSIKDYESLPYAECEKKLEDFKIISNEFIDECLKDGDSSGRK